MSASETVESIDPRRLQGELVQYLETSIRYVRRQGLSRRDVRAIVERVLGERGKP